MMCRRKLLRIASLGFLGVLDRASSSRALGGAIRDEEPGAILESHRAVDAPVAISPDGRWAATAESDCSFRVWDGATGAPAWTEPGAGDLVRSLSFSDDSRRLVVGGRTVPWRRTEFPIGLHADDKNPKMREFFHRLEEQSRVDAYNNVHSRQVKVLDLAARKLITLADSRDGVPVLRVFDVGDRSVMVIDASGRITRWDSERPDDFRLVDLPKRPGEAVYPELVALDRDGRRLAALHGWPPNADYDPRDHPSSRIRLVDVALRKLRILKNYDRTVWSLAISRDGAWVATGNGTSSGIVSIWDYESGKRVRTLPSDTGRGVPFLAFSPDGKELVTSTEEGDRRVWDYKEGRLIRRVDGPARQARAVAFMGDRLRVVSGGKRFLKFDPVKRMNPLEPLVLWDEPPVKN